MADEIRKVGRKPGHRINRDAWDDVVVDLQGLTLVRVAEDGDLPLGTLKAIVSGNDKASTEMAHKIARAARCRPRTLFPTLALEFANADPNRAA